MSGEMAPLDFLFPSEAALIQQDAAGITSDPSLAVSITYNGYTGRTFTPSTGLWTEAPTVQTGVLAIRNVLKASEVVAGEGIYQAGDVRYLIAKAVLAVEPNGNDTIVENGAEYSMVTWDTDPVGAFWRLVMRKIR